MRRGAAHNQHKYSVSEGRAAQSEAEACQPGLLINGSTAVWGGLFTGIQPCPQPRAPQNYITPLINSLIINQTEVIIWRNILGRVAEYSCVHVGLTTASKMQNTMAFQQKQLNRKAYLCRISDLLQHFTVLLEDSEHSTIQVSVMALLCAGVTSLSVCVCSLVTRCLLHI